MTPPRRPPPHVQMVEHLARLRRTGAPFDSAWSVVLRERILWPHDGDARRVSRQALHDTREEWRAAYEGTETRLSRALSAISEDSEAEDTADLQEGVVAA